jgi:hypothetical protein
MDNTTQIRNFFRGPRNKHLELKVPKEDFNSIQNIIDSATEYVRYEYSWINNDLILYAMPSLIHESLIGPICISFTQLREAIKADIPSVRMSWRGSGNTTLHNTAGRRTREKAADASINLRLGDEEWSSYPLIVFEIGYSETEEELALDARQWLYESRECVVCGVFCPLVYPNVHPRLLWG